MDKIAMILNKENAPNTDFLAEIPIFLKNVSVHNFENGSCIVGRLNNFKITITENRVKISDASLTKFLFGNNIQMMNISDIKTAIHKLSDELHLPITLAEVNSFEFGKNIITKYPPEVYFRYLGNKPNSTRFAQDNSIYYNQTNSQFVGYNKLKETKDTRGPIPELYKNCNLLRFEKRYKKNLANYFNCSGITAGMLFDESFYMQIVDDWYNEYRKINKIQLHKIDFSMIKTKEQYKLLGVLELVRLQGGELEAIANIKEEFKKKTITRKQRHDLERLIKSASKNQFFTIPSDEIKELDEKVKECIKYYR